MRALAPKGGNDRIYTPIDLARNIVNHFNPTGTILEPCKGNGAFTSVIPSAKWCEIDEGLDFFNFNEKVDWVVTNPPWSIIRPFLIHSMEISDNIVFLCLINAFWMRARLRDIEEFNFGIKEILMIKTPKCWPQTGFQLGATYLKAGYGGQIKLSKLKNYDEIYKENIHSKVKLKGFFK